MGRIEVEVVVRVVFDDEEVVALAEGQDFAASGEGSSVACRVGAGRTVIDKGQWKDAKKRGEDADMV